MDYNEVFSPIVMKHVNSSYCCDIRHGVKETRCENGLMRIRG